MKVREIFISDFAAGRDKFTIPDDLAELLRAHISNMTMHDWMSLPVTSRDLLMWLSNPRNNPYEHFVPEEVVPDVEFEAELKKL